MAIELLCPSDLYFFNPIGTGKPVASYWDAWYLNYGDATTDDESLPAASIVTRLVLDDADVENACLSVIQGSRRWGVVDRRDVEAKAYYFLPKRVTVTLAMEGEGIPVYLLDGAGRFQKGYL